MSKYRKIIDLLEKADIKINGDRPWDVKIYNEIVFEKVISKGSLGLGESYMDGDWDSERVDLFIEKLIRAEPYKNKNISFAWLYIKARLFNLQSFVGAKKVIDEHYDLDHQLYMSFLDPYNQYTCGYFKDTEDLNVAQEQKLDLICKKLQLKEGDELLDIGCGWGGLAKFAAEKYGCKVTGISISEEQIKFARDLTKGLNVEILNLDYRDLNDRKFDKIVSVGMLEHVGYKNYRQYMEIVSNSLKDNGLFLLHTIGNNETHFVGEPWSDKYIFPGGMVASIKQIGEAVEELLVMEDWHNFGPYYYNTLIAWDKNFVKNWGNIKVKYSERFYKMFRYYFLSFAGAFKARDIQLWQVVFSKGGSDKVYNSIR